MASARVATTMPGLEFLRAIVRGELPPPPMARLLGFTIVEVEHGRVVFEIVPGEEHYNPIGVVHGGYAATLLDSAMGCAVHTTLERGAAYTTLSLEVKMVRPLTAEIEKVRAEGEVVYRGRRQATVAARLLSADGKLLAHGTSTCMILG